MHNRKTRSKYIAQDKPLSSAKNRHNVKETILENPSRDPEFYRAALMGAKGRKAGDYVGLRSYASGFTADEGYDLRHIANWTAAQKAKVTRYYHEVQESTARPFAIVRPRSEKHLRLAQRVAQQDPKFKQMKVAFLPFVGERPGDKPNLSYQKDSVTIRGEYYERRDILFDPRKLAKNSKAEIDRALSQVPNATRYHIQANKFDISGMTDRAGVQRAVSELMKKYDGKSVPASRRRDASWKPKHHHWSEWLVGVAAYTFRKKGDPQKFLRKLEKAKTDLRRQRKNRKRK